MGVNIRVRSRLHDSGNSGGSASPNMPPPMDLVSRLSTFQQNTQEHGDPASVSDNLCSNHRQVTSVTCVFWILSAECSMAVLLLALLGTM